MIPTMKDKAEEVPRATLDYVGCTVQGIIQALKKDYPILKNYPITSFIRDNYDVKLVSKKFGKKLIDKTYDVNSDDIEHITSFKVKTKDFYIFSDYYPLLHCGVMIVFAKDKQKLKEIFAKNVLVYPIGNYNLRETSCGIILDPIGITHEDTPKLKKGYAEQINKDISMFFKKKAFFKKNNLAFKRGILLYGPPGNGKTSFIKYLLEQYPDKFGIVIDCSGGFSKDITNFLKHILLKEDKIIVLEDIDGLKDFARSNLLNFLDGIDSVENTVFVATTNNVTDLDPALIERPSRFDRAYMFDNPDKDTRRILLKKFFPKLNRNSLQTFIKKTEGFSGAYFKELFIFKNLQNCSLDIAIKNMKLQIELYESYNKDRAENTKYVG